MWGQNWFDLNWGAISAAQVPIGPWVLLALGFLLGIFAVRARGSAANAVVIMLAAVVVPVVALTATSSLPYTFTNGTVADADQVNANFEHIETTLTALSTDVSATTEAVSLLEANAATLTNTQTSQQTLLIGLAASDLTNKEQIGSNSESLTELSSVTTTIAERITTLESQNPGSCSATQEESGVSIICPDGTSGFLPAAGTVALLPLEGTTGELPPTTYPTGAVVVVDGAGTQIGEASRALDNGEGAEIQITAEGRAFNFFVWNNNVSETVKISPPASFNFYYRSNDCTGTPFGSSNFALDIDGDLFVRSQSVQPNSILFGSRRRSGYFGGNGYVSTTPCAEAIDVVNAAPMVPFSPPTEIAEAVWPIRLEQLP